MDANLDAYTSTYAYPTCHECEGAGGLDVDCPTCEGTGDVRCVHCDGTGDGPWTPCPCPDCSGHHPPCTGCDGQGNVHCKACRGTGERWQECPTCHSAGVVCVEVGR